MVDEIEVIHTTEDARLAIVGLGINLPGCEDLEEFSRRVFTGECETTAVGSWNPAGTLDKAIQSALGGRNYSIDVGVFLTGKAIEVGNTLPSGLKQLIFRGYDEPLPAMLVKAIEWFENQAVDLVVLAGSCFNPQSNHNTVFGFDQSVQAISYGSGTIAIAIMPLGTALRQSRTIYAVIEAFAFTDSGGHVVSRQGLVDCARCAMETAGIVPGEVGLVEALASGKDPLDEIEIAALNEAYGGDRPSTLIGSARQLTGYLDELNGLASLAKVGVCLRNQIRPGCPGWSGPKFRELWTKGGFYVMASGHTWFVGARPASRIAGLNCFGMRNGGAHLLVREVEDQTPRFGQEIRMPELHFLPVGFSSTADLIEKLGMLKQDLESHSNASLRVKRAIEEFQEHTEEFRVVFLGRSSADLLREIGFGERGIPSALAKGADWQSPGGSFFTSRPLGPDAKISFVYPGAFNSYPEAGRDLFYLYPGLLEKFRSVVDNIAGVICDTQLYPRSLVPIDKARADRLESDLMDDPYAMMASGLSLAVALTFIFKEFYGIKPFSAFGYSLGENSMLFALEAWRNGDKASIRLINSPLFKTRLAGPQTAIREYWGIGEKGGQSEELWANHLVMAPVERVQEEIRRENRVYLTHINTPRQVVIAGDPLGCRDVIGRLKCSALRAPFHYALHCQAMASEHAALKELHTLPVFPVDETRMFSAASGQPFPLISENIAEQIATNLCSMLDFPQLVNTVYNDGARIFIELGAAGNCAKWIEDVLNGKSYLAVSSNRKGMDDASSIHRALARLVSHGVQVQLQSLLK